MSENDTIGIGRHKSDVERANERLSVIFACASSQNVGTLDNYNPKEYIT